ncbi:MAG: GNAT family N-acetyltransferase [Candidatus Odinarchaeota archaeon]
MQEKRYIIKTMSRKEVDIAIEWAAKEGWNPGRHDAECYFEADPNGFIIGMFGEEPIATISAIKYGRTFGFIGFYIVKPEYRNMGYGIQIWNAALKYLEGRNIGLDGVVTQQSNYKKSGFKLAYRNIRYEGIADHRVFPASDIVNLSELPFDTIDSYDAPFFPENRSKFINTWISKDNCHSLGIMQNGKFSGYGVIRLCRVGYKIGPLFADNPELAEFLFMALKSKAETGKPIFLDVPEVNQSAVVLAERCNMKISFETARMYKKEVPDMPLNRIFGVTSFEIG